MVTYYTAIGRMVTKEVNGNKVPVIMVEDSDYMVSVDELIIWSSLHWNFLVKDALEKEYSRRKVRNRVFNDTSFDQTLNRLETRGLIASGTDYIAADALYNLISTLKIRPARTAIFDRLKSICYFYFVKGVPFSECYKSYFGINITPDEESILRLSKKIGITTSEIIQCAEKKIKRIHNEEDIIGKVYSRKSVDFQTVAAESKFSELKADIIKAVANLYMKKRIIFEN